MGWREEGPYLVDMTRRLSPEASPTTEAKRRIAHEQALASTRISGHEPTPEFLADSEAVVRGDMTYEEARARSLARARAADAAAMRSSSTDMPPLGD